MGNEGEADITTGGGERDPPPRPHFILLVNWSPDLRSRALSPFLYCLVKLLQCTLLLEEGWLLAGKAAAQS